MNTIEALIDIDDKCRVYVEGIEEFFSCKAPLLEPGLYQAEKVDNGYVYFQEKKVASEWPSLSPKTTYILQHEYF